VVLDRATQPVVLFSPVASPPTFRTLNLTYALGEAPKASSVTVAFVTTGFTLTLTMKNLLLVSFVWNPAAVTTPESFSTFVASASPAATNLRDGTYTVTISYQDLGSNNPSTASVSNMILDFNTRVPTLSAPRSTSTYIKTIPVIFLIPEATSAAPTLTFLRVTDGLRRVLTLSVLGSEIGTALSFTLDPTNILGSARVTGLSDGVTSGPTLIIPDGRYTVTLSYADAIGNPASSAVATDMYLTTSSEPARRVTLTLGLDFASTITASNPVAVFGATFVADVARALSAPASRFRFRSATASSILVSFDILQSATAGDPTSASLFAAFVVQFSTAGSVLRGLTSNYTRFITASASYTELDLCLNTVTQDPIGCTSGGGSGDPGTNTSSSSEKLDVRVTIGIIALIIIIIALCVGFWIHYVADKKKREKAAHELEKINEETFDKLDVNHDGAVTREEFVHAYTAAGAHIPSPSPTHADSAVEMRGFNSKNAGPYTGAGTADQPEPLVATSS